MEIIDPHIHLFDLVQGQYDWLKSENPPFWEDKPVISKSFTEQDLHLTPPLSLAGFVHIEAGFDNQKPWREIAWLERHCQLPFRAIAMLDITLPNNEFCQQLEQLQAFQSVVGIRYILDENALAILCEKNTMSNFAVLAQCDLSFDVQMPLHDNQSVQQLITIASLLPTLMLCINHAGWPPLSFKHAENWQSNIKRLSNLDNIYIKCSGFEMATREYTYEWLWQVIHFVIEHFGEHRTLFASNFPLCLFRDSYKNTWHIYTTQTGNKRKLFTSVQLQNLCANNAKRFYRL